ncbi:DUF839 domain-containing protein [Vibrio lentus]|nr:DUF839 domain-containing protein [Vibrio lentus]
MSLNRRYTGATANGLIWPSRTYRSYCNSFSPDISQARGTLNNCGNGFARTISFILRNWLTTLLMPQAFELKAKPHWYRHYLLRYLWDTLFRQCRRALVDEFTRFNMSHQVQSSIDDYRNEISGHGYIVEIDPYTENARAKKRTALGDPFPVTKAALFNSPEGQ